MSEAPTSPEIPVTWEPCVLRRSVGAAGSRGVVAVPELLRRLTEVERVERERDVEVRRPQGPVLVLGDRRVVVDVPAEDLVTERVVVARVQHGDVPDVVEALPHGEGLVGVDRDQEHEALELHLHLGDVLGVEAQTVLHVQTLARHVPGGDPVPELELVGGDTLRRHHELRSCGHFRDPFISSDKCYYILKYIILL